MLSRRAAGVFPRDQDTLGELFIPIFTCDADGQNAEVSAMLIHAKNCDFNVEGSTKEDSVPRWSLSSGSASLRIPRDSVSGGIIHVVMNFNGNRKPRNHEIDSHTAEASCVLHLEGVRHDFFVPQGVAEELDLLLVPRWTITELVEEDLYWRKSAQTSFVLTNEQIEQKVRCTLSKHFLGTYQDEEEKSTPRNVKAEVNGKRRKV